MRLSAIGDVCNTVAVVQMIQRQWPETSITWITGKLEAQLIQNLPNIRVVIFDKKAGWSGYRALWQALKDEKFDALLHMQYALRASIATLGIKAKYKLGFDTERAQDFQTLFTNIKVPSPSNPHVLDGLIAFAKTLGVEDRTPIWNIPFSNSDQEWASSQIDVAKKTVVIVPAASKGYKNWTAAGYADVITYIQKLDWQILLAGSPAQIEVDLATEVESLLENPIINLVGKSSLLQMQALICKADLVIAPDTGPAHMANATNTPVIGLYAHHNPKRTGPYNYRNLVVSVYEKAIEEETNKSANELPWRSRVKNKNAMQLISSDMVISMFNFATLNKV
jgi:heptosyltransferase I